MNVFSYKPQPKQLVLHQSRADEIFYGGAAGGGKSYSMRWDGIEMCQRVPGLQAYLFRRTMPRLETNHVIPMKKEIPQHIAKYNETKKRFEFSNGSIMFMTHLEHEKDTENIQGAEIHWAGVDEGGQFTPYQLGYIKSRIRLGGFKQVLEQMAEESPWLRSYVDRLPRLVIASNPGGEAHHYLKENFIDPWPVGMREFLYQPDRGKPVRRIFIPAGMIDNTFLDENYEAQFDGLPDWQVTQLVDGDWNVVPGAFFDCWTPKNIIKPFNIPAHWTRFWSCDWGFRQPFWIGEWAVADDTQVFNIDGKKLRIKPGCLILVWEWYGRESGNKGIRMKADAVGRALIAERGDLNAVHVADPAIWRTDSGPSAGEHFMREGVVWQKGENERVAGWQELYSRIKDGMLLVFENCPHFIRVIPTLQHDDRPGKEEDVKKRGEDHPADGARYACMSRPYLKDRPSREEPYWVQAQRPPTFDEAMRHNELRSKRTVSTLI